MKRFLVRLSLFLSPILMLVMIYLATDVFRVLYHHDPYYTNSYVIGLNRSYGSTMTYINQDPNINYDSFIFGNSRSLLYEIDTWKTFLAPNSHCMHFDESIGSISGIHDKIVFIDKRGGQINNALLVIDYQLLSYYDLEDKGYLFISPPILKNYSNVISFHWKHLRAFLTPKFLFALADYSIFKTFRPYMHDIIQDQKELTYIAQYNEFQRTLAEEMINDGIYYDKSHTEVFENIQKPNTYSNECLDNNAINSLKEVKAIFDKHHTSYKIVISPLYDQIRLNPDTLNQLCTIFGEENVFDFSGTNKWNSDYHNYYEESHYRPIVSAEIMSTIYK